MLNILSRQMSLRKKILCGYGFVLTLAALVFAWAVVNLVELGRAGDAILRENYKSILAAENMIDAIERQDSATLLVLLGYESEGLLQFRENESQFLQWLGRAKDNVTIEGEEDILAAIETGYTDYLTDFTRLLERRGGDMRTAGEFYHENVLVSFKSVRDASVGLREINHETMFEASRRAERVMGTAIWSTVGVGVAVLALGLGFSLLLSKRLVSPIRQIMQATEELAAENYEARVSEHGSDELARLASSFNAMAEKLGSYHRLNLETIIAEKRKGDAVLRSIEDGVVVVDADFSITNMNPQAGRMLTLGAETVIGKHFLEICKKENLFELIKQTAASGKPPQIEEGKDVLSVGEGDNARHYMFGITPVISKETGMQGVVLLLRDITRLKELDRLKSEFVMTASHELKTPLHSLGMSVELLKEKLIENIDIKSQRLLDAAGEEVARLNSLVSDLLDLSKIEAGKLEMEFDSVSPAMLVNKAVGVFSSQCQNKKIELTAQLEDGLSDVRADANKITWVLTNLIANALRYARNRIGIHARIAGPWLHISVEDDGQGIDPENQSRIFDKFVQVKDENSVGGTGLGLAICKEIIHAHKGTIWVDSTPGQGSRFTFTLPLDEER